MTIVVIMGVSGSGKSTVAAGLCKAEGWQLIEGDALHPPGNIAKMSAGTPLTDDDRWPWLRAIAARLDELRAANVSAVVACSALKRSYRDVLIGDRPDTYLVYLRSSHRLIGERMRARKGHFMPPGLLDSQFASLHEPGPDERPIIADLARPAEEVVAQVVARLRELLASGAA
jgi:gluconokinase